MSDASGRSPDAQRERLVELALGLIEREGRDAITLRRLAAEAGISRATPYGYFADKAALLDAVRVAALDRLAGECAVALAEDDDAALRLAGVGRAWVRFAFEHPALYDLIFEPAEADDAHRAAVFRTRTLCESPLRELASAGRIAGDPATLATLLLAATHGLIAMHRGGKLPAGSTFEEHYRALGDTLAFGFVPRPGGEP